jgi:hypothetical protein
VMIGMGEVHPFIWHFILDAGFDVESA